jgi:DNA replication protein DnaC
MASNNTNARGTDSVTTLEAAIEESMNRRRAQGEAVHRSESRLQTVGPAFGEVACQLGKRYAPERVRLADFEIYHPAQESAIRSLLTYESSIEERIREGSGLVLYGAVGTGKDRLLAYLIYSAAVCGIRCHYAHGQDLFGAFRDRMDAGQKEEELIDRMHRPAVLAISDPAPPAGELSAWRLELLYRIVDRRYRDLRPTWVTINAESPNDAEGRLGSQVWDRIQEGAAVIPCLWPSYRERRTNRG